MTRVQQRVPGEGGQRDVEVRVDLPDEAADPDAAGAARAGHRVDEVDGAGVGEGRHDARGQGGEIAVRIHLRVHRRGRPSAPVRRIRSPSTSRRATTWSLTSMATTSTPVSPYTESRCR